MTVTHSKIEWCDSTWNPTTGCTQISNGCDHCYAKTMTERFHGPGSFDRIQLHPDRLDAPLRWRKPRRVFVNSVSDLFHKDIPDEFIARVWAVMAATPQHTYQILTKRHGRMRSWVNRWYSGEIAEPYEVRPVARFPGYLVTTLGQVLVRAPARSVLPSIWLGVSVEDQRAADLRIPALLDTPAAVRFVSCEPLLSPVDLNEYMTPQCECCTPGPGRPCVEEPMPPSLDWVIAGGESGKGARPLHPDWARQLRDQCQAAEVPFFFKQWGEWKPAPWRVDRKSSESVEDYKLRAESVCATHALPVWANEYGMDPMLVSHKPWSLERTELPGTHAGLRRCGKKRAGRELDGRTWDEFPSTVTP